jgi:hypothetical protein
MLPDRDGSVVDPQAAAASGNSVQDPQDEELEVEQSENQGPED